MNEADIQLRIRNFYPSSFKIKSRKKVYSVPYFSKKISPSNVIDFTYELSALLSTGISITTALKMISDSHENLKVQQLLLSIKSNIETGKNLAEALKAYPSHFTHFFIHLVHIGEQSGTLHIQLHQAASYLEKIFNFKHKLKKALTYPFFILLVAFTLTFGLLTFIIPQFQSLFQNLGAELPPLTRFIIKLPSYLKCQASFIMALSIGCIGIHSWKKKSLKLRRWVDSLLLKLPIFGKIMKYALLTRICHLLSVTYKANISFPDAFSRLAQSIENQVYSTSLMKVNNEIKAGKSLGMAISSTRLFPKRIYQMIYIGEQSGTLEVMFEKTALYYENKLDQYLEQLNKWLEPIIIIFLGLSIGMIIMAMYLPIFRLGSLF